MTVREEKFIDAVTEVRDKILATPNSYEGVEARSGRVSMLAGRLNSIAKSLTNALKEFCETGGGGNSEELPTQEQLQEYVDSANSSPNTRQYDFNFDDDSEAKNRQELMEDKGVMEHGPLPHS